MSPHQPTESYRPQPIDDPNATPTVNRDPSQTGDYLPTEKPSANLGIAPAGFEIIRELGRGGMGAVYLARQAKLNRLVALKMILAGDTASETQRRRFLTEGEVIARLQHPGIVQIFEFGELPTGPYFALEYVDGGTLSDKAQQGPMEVRDAAIILRKLAAAMHAAHRRGIVHRDLKPANILFTTDGEPKITDFGIAKLDDGSVTVAGAIMGTPKYMAPEQASGRSDEAGPAADIWALGVILYELLTRQTPFPSDNKFEILRLIEHQEPIPPTRLRREIPRDLETICQKCLAKEPASRYLSANALAEDLDRFLNHQPILARPVSRSERAVKWVRRNPVLAGLIAAGTLVLLLGAVVVVVARSLVQEQEHRSSADKAKIAAETARSEADSARAEETRQKGIAVTERDRAQSLQQEADAAKLKEEVARKEAEEAKADIEKLNYLNSVQEARRLFAENRIEAALQKLEECPVRLRNWEWQYVHRMATVTTQRVVLPQSRPQGMVFSGDGSRVATIYQNGGIRVFEATTGKVLFKHREGLMGVHVHLDHRGEHVAFYAPRGAVKVMRVADGHLIDQTPENPKLRQIALSPDGKRLALATSDPSIIATNGVIEIRDLVEKKVVHTIDRLPHLGGITFGPDGEKIAVGLNSQLRIYTMRQGESPLYLQTAKGMVETISFSRDGHYCGLGITPGAYDIFDLRTKQRVRGGQIPNSYRHRVAFSSDEKSALVVAGKFADLLRVSLDKPTDPVVPITKGRNFHTAIYLNAETVRILHESGLMVEYRGEKLEHEKVLPLEGEPYKGTYRIQISPNGRYLFFQQDSSSLYDLNTRTFLRHPILLSSYLRLRWLPDDQGLLLADEDTVITLELPSMKEKSRHRTPSGRVVFSNDGKTIAVLGQDIQVFEMGRSEAVRKLTLPAKTFIAEGAFGTNARDYYGLTPDLRMLKWEGDATQAKELFQVPREMRVSTMDMEFVPKLNAILCRATETKRFVLLDCETGKLLWERESNDAFPKIAISQDAERFFISRPEGSVEVVDRKSGSLVTTLRGHVQQATVSSDLHGDCVVTSAMGGDVRLYRIRDSLPTVRIAFSETGTPVPLEGAELALCTRFFPLNRLADEDESKRWVDLTTAKISRVDMPVVGKVLGFCPRGEEVIGVVRDQGLRRVNLTTNEVRMIPMPAEASSIEYPIVTEDVILASGASLENKGNWLAAWDRKTGERKWFQQLANMNIDFGWKMSADGSRLLTINLVTEKPSIGQLWDTATGKIVWTSPPLGQVGTVSCLSHDGRFVASGTADGLQVFDVASNRKLFEIPASLLRPRMMAFSPDNTRLAVATSFGTVMILEVPSGRRALEVPSAAAGEVVYLAFTKDGSSLMEMIGGDRSVYYRRTK